MLRRRAWVAAATALPLAMTGITAATVAPAGASPSNTTVTCGVIPETPQSYAVLDCVVADPDGIRSIEYFYPEYGYKEYIESSGDFACGGVESPAPFGLGTTPPTKIKLTVTDCEDPRRRTVFMVHPDGTVRGGGSGTS